MTQEDKQLLLKDLCAKLPYGVIVKLPHPYEEFKASIKAINPERGIVYYEKYGVKGSPLFDTSIWRVKPYLRPISSMTEKEWKEYHSLRYCDTSNADRVDFLNSHHLDYRGLIEKGLALEAPEGMYKIKSTSI